MPEAAGVRTDLPAPLPLAIGGTAAGRKPEAAGTSTELAQRVLSVADGLQPLVATAEAAQEARAKAHGAPRWTDVFTTQFTEFSNRPR